MNIVSNRYRSLDANAAIRYPFSFREKKTVAEGKAWPRNEEYKVRSHSG